MTQKHDYEAALAWLDGCTGDDGDYEEWAAANESTIRAALKLAQLVQSGEWKLVPVVPTEVQLQNCGWLAPDKTRPMELYMQMVADAPKPEEVK